MNDLRLRRLGLVALLAAPALHSCDPDPRGAAFLTPDLIVGVGDWSGSDGFVAYAPGGRVLESTDVRLFADADGDGSLQCGEQLSTGAEALGEALLVRTGSDLRETDFVHARIDFAPADGQSLGLWVSARPTPSQVFDVSGLGGCLSGGASQVDPGAWSVDATTQPDTDLPEEAADASYDLRDEFGQLLMRVSIDANGELTILAGNAANADGIDMLMVDAGGTTIRHDYIAPEFTDEGFLARFPEGPQPGHYTILSLRRMEQPLFSFLIDDVEGDSDGSEDILRELHQRTFR